MNALTILILVPNAADRLPRCLESAAWADDVFCIVDTETTDGSLEVAKEHTDHVVVRKYVGAADQKNWGIEQVKTDWTLILDADEWLSEELSAHMRKIVADRGGPDYYRIKRRSYFFGKLIRYCGWQRDYNIRLFRTAKGRYQKRNVHATIETSGPVGTIEEPMYHDTHRSFEEYLATFQRFTTWGAQDAFDAGRRARVGDLTLRPMLRFLKMYVLQRGFLDGSHGAVLCVLASFAVFMKYAKLWNLGRLAREAGAESA